MSNHNHEAGDHLLPEKPLKELFVQSHDRGRAGLPVMSLSMDRGLVPRNQDERRVETNLSDEQHRLVRAGELAYNMMRMWQGVCGLAQEDCLISPAYVVVRPLNGMDPKFSEYLLTYEETVAKFKRLSFGVVDDRLRLYFKDFERVRVRTQPPPVQRKIARILTTLDSLIETTEALIAKYQAVKKGMMHDIFTRGIDEHGHLRPPQSEAPDLYKQSELGWIPKEWEETTVGNELVGIDAGKSPDCPDLPAPPGEWGVLKVSAVQPDGFLSHENKVITNQCWANPMYEVHDGDLLISRSNTYQLVGIVCLVRSPQPRLMLCDKTLRLRFDPRRAKGDFMFWLLQQPLVRRQIEIHATGTSGSMKNISQPVIRSLKIALPPVLEQERIKSRIQTIQEKMTTERRTVEKLKYQKIGLMQDLLTGKVRVNADEAENAVIKPNTKES